MRKQFTVSYLLSLSLAVTNVSAAGYQSIDSIHDAARQFVLARTAASYDQAAEVKVDGLDSRLKLTQCDLPLDVFVPQGSRDLGRFTVGVKCAGARPWSLHVPVTVTIFKRIVVAADPLPRGKILDQSDLKTVSYDVSKLPAGYIEDPADGVGMELRRRLSGGVPLTTTMVRKPKIIKRGQQVSIIATTGNIEVRTAGKALAHGAVGERIRVLNVKTKRTLEGTVTASGEIRVDI